MPALRANSLARGKGLDRGWPSSLIKPRPLVAPESAINAHPGSATNGRGLMGLFPYPEEVAAGAGGGYNLRIGFPTEEECEELAVFPRERDDV